MMIIPARNVTITAGFPQVWICYLNKHKFQAYFWRASARVFWTKIMGAIFEGWGRERNLYLGNGRRSKIRSGVGVGMWRFIYIIHACWLVLTCDLFEDRRIDDVIVNDIVLFFSIKSNIDSKFAWVCTVIDHIRRENFGKNISDTLGCASFASSLFVPHFVVVCHLFTEQAHGNVESVCLLFIRITTV